MTAPLTRFVSSLFPINTKGETRRNESRLFCETIITPLPSAKDRCRNSLPIYRPMALWCYPMCRAFRISRMLRQQQIKVAFKPLRTLNSFFPRPKAQERVDRPQSGTVYKISCTNCSFVYFGQTERSLKTRIAEHKRAVSMFDHNSKINHEMNFGNVRVVGHVANYHKRLFLEASFSVQDPQSGIDHIAIPVI